MAFVTVTRIYRFRGIHSLPDFPEPWCFPHQHDYTVEIECEGGSNTDRLDRWWDRHGLEDGDMNNRFKPSTVENIAEQLLASLQASFPCVSVTVREDRARFGKAVR